MLLGRASRAHRCPGAAETRPAPPPPVPPPRGRSPAGKRIASARKLRGADGRRPTRLPLSRRRPRAEATGAPPTWTAPAAPRPSRSAGPAPGKAGREQVQKAGAESRCGAARGRRPRGNNAESLPRRGTQARSRRRRRPARALLSRQLAAKGSTDTDDPQAGDKSGSSRPETTTAHARRGSPHSNPGSRASRLGPAATLRPLGVPAALPDSPESTGRGRAR